MIKETKIVPIKVQVRVYTCLITQAGAGNPTITELLNTTGKEIIWTREGQGEYVATAEKAFRAGKTIGIMTCNDKTKNMTYECLSDGSWHLKQWLISTGNPVDNIATGTTIEIRIYDNN